LQRSASFRDSVAGKSSKSRAMKRERSENKGLGVVELWNILRMPVMHPDWFQIATQLPRLSRVGEISVHWR
jgi:hypothetical protein